MVREYCGHGIGRGFHEEPQVLHYDSPETNVVLKPGMTFTIEPMVNAGKKEIRSMKDGWTVKTKDRELVCAVRAYYCGDRQRLRNSDATQG
ncbi:methionine aminopeptidase [Klebsiella pneumoniae subsp. ozaenae]|uniref:Methionine aminopeptidase n=1 Tax=Klebsiella pneumoniae subsp. ozaenae TaxID=574 RepID=A0A378C0L3_KLEPO|nr:methionine aminopeptidase [Klebsiella pneumoniae subsp. ozaenae]